jgi:DNA polymerase elongation subunit (family B)
VSDSELGIGKLDGGDVGYESDRTKYMAYNIVDVMLTVELNEISGFISFWMMLSDICSIPPYLVGTEMYEVEGFLFGNREDNEILPDREDDKEMDMISGGFVLPPYDGLKEWVGVVDLKSLYPSSMISCNISRETMTYDEDEADIIIPDIPLNYNEAEGKEITEEDISWELGKGNCVGFTLDEQGIMPKYVSMLFDERADKKAKRNQADPDSTEYERFNQQQRAVKVVMNSFFGVSDHPYFRLAANGLGAAITGVSRYVSWLGVQAIESEGYDLVYGDTDSLLMSLTDKDEIDGEDLDPTKAAVHLQNLEEVVNSHLDQAADDCNIPAQHPFIGPDMHGTDRHLWMYEAEKVYKRFLQTGVKKRYAGKIKWKEGKLVDSTDITGYETEKSDSSPITKEVQKGVIDRALEGKGFEELTGYLQTEIAAIKQDLHPLRKVAFPSVLNKPPEEYPNRPIKRATLYSNNHLHADWSDGDTPWYVYVDQTPYGKPNTDVIAVDWTRESLPSGFELDGEAHIEKTIQQPIEPIAESLGFSWSELREGKQEQSVCERSDASGPDEIFG